MISKETAVKIWSAHDEIDNAQKMITDMAEILAKDAEKEMPKFHNAFGDRVGLELGVPSGSGSRRIFGVNPELSIKIIEDHIKTKQARLAELMAIAKIELYQA